MLDSPANATAIRQREKHIQNEILREFGTKSTLRIWRQNTGAATFYGQRVTFGVPGQADISGILPDGKRLEIEVKSAVGRQAENQKAFQALVTRFNGLYILARSVEDVYKALHAAGYTV